MGDLLRKGIEMLSGVLDTHAASTVVYSSSEKSFYAEMKATYGKTDVTYADDAGSSITTCVFDFLIAAAYLPIEPDIGDIIEADGHEFQVLPVAGEVWRWSDPFMKIRRIHAKQMDGADE